MIKNEKSETKDAVIAVGLVVLATGGGFFIGTRIGRAIVLAIDSRRNRIR